METRPFILNASVLDEKDQVEAFRQDVQYNRIDFEFPNGFSTIPILEECRALNALDDFDMMYDITMQLLTEKPVFIYIKDINEGKRYLVAKFIVTHREMDLRGVDFISRFPVVVTWLAEFIGEMLRKKFPRPLPNELQAMAEAVEKLPKATIPGVAEP